MLRSKRSLAARQREMRKRQPPRRGRGRPPLPIDPDRVANLAAQGYTMLEVAALLGCSPNTLYGRFRPDFERGQARLTVCLISILFAKAMEGDWRALRWQMKFRGLFGEKLPKRPRPSASSRATYGGARRSRGRRRILSRLAPKKAPSGAKNQRQQQPRKAVTPEISGTPPAPKPVRGRVRSYEILW